MKKQVDTIQGFFRGWTTEWKGNRGLENLRTIELEDYRTRGLEN